MTLEEKQQYLRQEAAAGRGKLIALTKGFVVLVDNEDFEEQNSYSWCLLSSRKSEHYAVRGNSPQRFYLHRVLLKAAKGQQVDHQNRNSLDCRKKNLRLSTQQQNMGNRSKRSDTTSRYKGVSYTKARSHLSTPFRAFIGSGGLGAKFPSKHLGYYATEEEAARVYDTAALERYGEFVALNFP